MATRRRLLGQIALGLGVVACRGAIAQPAEHAAYVGAQTSAVSGLSQACFYTATGAPLGHAPLDFRAHGMAQAGPLVVVFPRRPGTRFAVIDIQSLEVRAVVDAPAGRHFYGHGAFTRDGQTLLVTENDLETLQGGLGVYELRPEVRRVDQIALPGSGPHEIARHPSRDRFYIALGGLETHPAYGRTALNLESFRSEVLVLEARNGVMTSMGHWSGSEGVSLRHLAMDGAGRLYVGGHAKDPARAAGSGVLWLVSDNGATPLPQGARLAGYVSSVAAHGAEALVTSKEAGRALHLRGPKAVAETVVDGAGAAALGPGLAALSGYAKLVVNGATLAALPEHEFDNHGLGLAQA